MREYSLTISPSFPPYVYVQVTIDVLTDIQYARIDERVLCNIILFLFPSSWSSGGRRWPILAGECLCRSMSVLPLATHCSQFTIQSLISSESVINVFHYLASLSYNNI